MYRIDSDGSVPALPAPAALATEGYWSKGNPLTGQAATVEDQDWFNMTQESLIAFLTASGLAHSKSDYSRLWQSIGRSITFPDVGSANAVVVALPAGLTFPSGSVGLGTVVRVKLANSFTGGATFAPFGLAPAPILCSDGTAAGVGDGVAGSIAEFVNDGAGHWQLLAGGNAAIRLTTVNPTIYVRNDGNDGNDGSANTSAKAVLTLARAYQLAARFFVPGGAVRIKLGAPGIWANTPIPRMGTPLIIEGDITDFLNYTIHGAGNNTIQTNGTSISLIGITVRNDDSSNALLVAAYGGLIAIDHVSLYALGISNTAPAMQTFPGGSITLGADNYVNANFGSLMYANGGGITLQAGGSIFAVGGPAFSDCTVRCTDATSVFLAGAFVGVATGVRYRVLNNAVIDTLGGGASYIFGNSPGVPTNNGLYV